MPFTPGLWATVICFVATVTASQLLTDKLWRRCVSVVKFKETSSAFTQYLLATFSAFCSQGTLCLVVQIIQRIMPYPLAYFSVDCVINYTSAIFTSHTSAIFTNHTSATTNLKKLLRVLRYHGDVIALVWPHCSPDHVRHSGSNSDQLLRVPCIPHHDEGIQVALQ